MPFSGYNWGYSTIDNEWDYHFSIKQALEGEESVGAIHLKSEAIGVDVIGHVEDFKENYSYWSSPNIAAVGTAEYNEMEYDFMLLYSKRAMWFVLTNDYEAAWNTGTTLSPRLFQVHGLNTDDYPMDYLDIH